MITDETSAKKITFTLLSQLPIGAVFSGAWLADVVVRKERELTGLPVQHYPDTILRYAREWRTSNAEKYKLKNVNKAKSYYQKQAVDR